MNRKSWLTWGGALLAGVALLAWAFSPRPLGVETGQAQLRAFELLLEEEGSTRLVERHQVSAPLAARLLRIRLREGDAVRVGDPLATLRPMLAPMLDARSTQQAVAAVQAAEALLNRSRAQDERAKVGVEQARSELRRSEQLARDGFIAPTKLDTDRLALQAAQRELEASRQDVHRARHELESARAVLGALQRGGGAEFVLRSPIDGQVLRVLQSSEAAVQPGTPLLEVGDLEKLEVVVPLLTQDALRAPPGTAVRVERSGLPGGPLEGVVVRIEPAAFTKVSALGVEEQRVHVRVRLTSPHSQWQGLGDGFRVWVRLVLLAEPQALCVPAAALFPHPDGEGMALFGVENGRARLRPVTMKARNADWAWLSSGVQAGTGVIVYPPSSLRDGDRVAVLAP